MFLLDQLSQAALDLLPAPVFIATVPQAAILRANRRAAELWPDAAGGAVRMCDVLHAVHPDGTRYEPGTDPIAAALARGERVLDVEGAIAASGDPIPVSISIEPIAGPGGRTVATLALCQRLVGWREIAAALRRSEQRLTLALSAGRLGAWEFNPQTRRLTSSPQCKANHGFAAADDMQLEAHILPAIEPGYRDAFKIGIERALDSGGAFENEAPHHWPDGSVHWLLVAGRVIDSTCMVGVSLDVTERRRAQEALVAADRGKDDFLALLSHELRSPLAPILTAVRLMQEKGPPDPAMQKLRQTILRQTMQLSKLVDDLLDVGRVVHGKLRLERSLADLNAIVRQAVETCTPFIDERRHSLSVSLPDAPLYVDVDIARMVQVVCNLLNNAAKYMREGGRMRVTAVAAGRHAEVRVSDEGVGISPEMLDRVFQRFVQVESSTYRAQGGLGLGLALVKAVVDLHGGSVEARSAGIGRGSEFVVRLPLAGK